MNVFQINSVPTKPIEGQKTGTSGLRKKVWNGLCFGFICFLVLWLNWNEFHWSRVIDYIKGNISLVLDEDHIWSFYFIFNFIGNGVEFGFDVLFTLSKFVLCRLKFSRKRITSQIGSRFENFTLLFLMTLIVFSAW